MTTKANNLAIQASNVDAYGIVQIAAGGTGLAILGTSGQGLISDGTQLVYGSYVSGYSGYSGISGYSGTSGYSGSGISGFSGFSGGTGSDGASGFSGISGFSGYSGTNGSAGASGFSGYSGSTGSAGTSGYSGFSGSNASVTGGNGISVSGGSVAVACPTFNTVGSYCWVYKVGTGSAGGNFSAGNGGNQVRPANIILVDGIEVNISISGTWKWMGADQGDACNSRMSLACRVS